MCLSYSPTEVRLAEDIVACLTKSMVHVFKIKLEFFTAHESTLHSLSMYSFRYGIIIVLKYFAFIYYQFFYCLNY